MFLVIHGLSFQNAIHNTTKWHLPWEILTAGILILIVKFLGRLFSSRNSSQNKMSLIFWRNEICLATLTNSLMPKFTKAVVAVLKLYSLRWYILQSKRHCIGKESIMMIKMIIAHEFLGQQVDTLECDSKLISNRETIRRKQ